MAKDKESFVLYRDLIHTVRKLSKEDAGELFIHILEYVNDENPETNNPFVDLAFEPIKQSLKRDLKKYVKTCERNAKNGAKGGRPKKPKQTEKTHSVISKPKKADSDSGSDTESDILNKDFDLFWSKYPNKVAKVKCKDKFNKLPTSDKQLILDTIDAYVKYKPFEGYNHPNPETYLNQKRWLDEIPQRRVDNNYQAPKNLKDMFQ